VDAERHNEQQPGDAEVELPLVVWAEDEETAQSAPPAEAPAAAEAAKAALAESASAPVTGQVPPISEQAGSARAESASGAATSSAVTGQVPPIFGQAESSRVESASGAAFSSASVTGQVPPISEQAASARAESASGAASSSGAVRGSGVETDGNAGTEASGLDHDAESEANPAILGLATLVAAQGVEVAAGDKIGRRRLSRPMIAAAAFSGVALVGLSVLFAQMGGPGPAKSAQLVGSAVFSRATSGPGLLQGGTGPTVPATLQTHPSPNGGKSPQSAKSAHSGKPAGTGQTTAATHSTQPGTSGGASTAPAGTGSSAPPPATYNAVGGHDCTDAGTGFAAYGWFDDGNSGFIGKASGGFTGDGCAGSYFAMPMSGADTDDTGNYILWTFDTDPVKVGTCSLKVYIPDVNDIIDVGGNPTYYTVQNSNTAYADTVGSFSIQQPSYLGQWVSEGSFPVSGSLLVVMLHSRGIDWTDTAVTYAHDAADAIQVSCTA
jgi:hypothetical protein